MAGRGAKQKEKAEKIFTDRIKPREAFDNSLKELLESPNDIFVLSYYGIGGIGKTKLLNVLKEKVIEINQKNDEKIIAVNYDFSITTDQRMVLLNLRNLFVQQGFEFPLWDFAEKQYSKITGQHSILVDNSVDKKNTMDNPYVDLLVECVNSIIPGTTLVLKAITATKSVIGDAETARKKLSEVIRKYFNNNEDDFSIQIKEMSTLGAEELLARFPDFFAIDLKNNIVSAKLPVVIMLDTYEKLVDTYKYLGYGEMQDDWLREDIVDVVPGVLWVIAGRECLHWEKRDSSWNGCIETHRLGDLAKEDSCEFLKYAKIPIGLWDDIFELTQGTPLFLDLCVDMYYDLEGNTEGDITIEMIAGKNRSKERLLERYVRYMSIDEREILEVEAMLGTWNDEQHKLIERICKKCFGRYNENLYKESLTHSIIYVDEKDNYILHDVVRQAIIQNMESRTKDYIFEEVYRYVVEMNDYWLDYYQEMKNLLRKIDLDQISEELVQKVISEILVYFEKKKKLYIPDTELVRLIYGMGQKMIISTIDIIDLEKILIDCLRRDRKNKIRYDSLIETARRKGYNIRHCFETKTMNYNRLNEELYHLNQKVCEYYQKLGKQDKETILYHYNVAEDLYYLGKYEEAIIAFERFIKLSKVYYGNSHTSTTIGYFYLGRAYTENRDYLMGLKKKIIAYGLCDNQTSDFWYKSGAYRRYGSISQQDIMEYILRDFEELRRCNNKDIEDSLKEAMRDIFVRYAYSIDYSTYEDKENRLKLEDYNKAYVEEMEEVERVLILMKELYEPDDDDILSVKHILTDKLCGLRKYDEALENEKYIQATYERKYGRDSCESVDSLFQIGLVYQQMRDTDNVISCYEMLLREELLTKIEEQDPFRAITLYSGVIMYYLQNGRVQDATDYVEKTKILCDKYRKLYFDMGRKGQALEHAMYYVDRYYECINGESQTTEEDDIFNFDIL